MLSIFAIPKQNGRVLSKRGEDAKSNAVIACTIDLYEVYFRLVQGGQATRKGVYFRKWPTEDTKSNAEIAWKKQVTGA